MKKIYQAPMATAIAFEAEEALLSGSKLSENGGSNEDVSLSDKEFDGTFQSNQWNNDSWQDED